MPNYNMASDLLKAKVELRRARSAIEGSVEVFEFLSEGYLKLSAENQRFQAALEEIASLPDNRADECSIIATRALDGQSTPEKP